MRGIVTPSLYLNPQTRLLPQALTFSHCPHLQVGRSGWIVVMCCPVPASSQQWFLSEVDCVSRRGGHVHSGIGGNWGNSQASVPSLQSAQSGFVTREQGGRGHVCIVTMTSGLATGGRVRTQRRSAQTTFPFTTSRLTFLQKLVFLTRLAGGITCA